MALFSSKNPVKPTAKLALKQECVMSELILTNHLLIAMPSLVDPNFAQSVTLICEHSEKGCR
jgi:putative AlgH/UPF0301 family transcriptional regulator